LDILGVRSLPFTTRRNYFYEFKHLLPWSVLAGLVEGQFASVVVAKTFHGGSLLIAVATATPFAAYVSSLVWGMLCVGRRKLRLSILFGAGAALCAALTGLIPAEPRLAWWFIAQVAAAQILLAGVVTVRSAIWRANYPHFARGQIAARLQAIRSIISVVTVQAAAALCDRFPSGYRFVFPLAALCGALGVVMLTRLHIRGERSEIRRMKRNLDADFREGTFEPYSLTALLSPGNIFRETSRILHNDRRFRQYCVAQFLQGVANLMTIPVVVAIVTRDLQLTDARGFWISTALVSGLPVLSLLASIRRWGRLFDSLGVLRFRVVNVLCWAASLLFGMLGTLAAVHAGQIGPVYYPAAVMLFALRGILHGVSQGGGTLAWNLGHLHFAKPEEAEVYMGIHVFLAGVRGLIAPLAGMWLWTTIGWSVWLIALAFVFSGLFFYYSLARREMPANHDH
jgi:MFS family permease